MRDRTLLHDGELATPRRVEAVAGTGLAAPEGMSFDELKAEVEQIATLVRDRRFDLALALTEALQGRIALVPDDDATVTPPVRDLIEASRQLTETLITLRGLQLH